MPTLLASIAIINVAFGLDLGIMSTRTKKILAFRVSKAAVLALQCTTRPGKDFQHKSVNGAEQSTKW